MDQPEAISKPKSITTLIAELEVSQYLNFNIEDERSIRAMISGNNRGGLKEKYPLRKFKTEKIGIPDSLNEILRVTRIA